MLRKRIIFIVLFLILFTSQLLSQIPGVIMLLQPAAFKSGSDQKVVYLKNMGLYPELKGAFKFNKTPFDCYFKIGEKVYNYVPGSWFPPQFKNEKKIITITQSKMKGHIEFVIKNINITNGLKIQFFDQQKQIRAQLLIKQYLKHNAIDKEKYVIHKLGRLDAALKTMDQRIEDSINKKLARLLDKKVKDSVEKKLTDIVEKRIKNLVDNLVDKRLSEVLDEKIKKIIQKKLKNNKNSHLNKNHDNKKAVYQNQTYKIIPFITSELSEDKIEPDVINLGDKFIIDNEFWPGTYTLTIEKLGYKPIRESFTIKPGKENIIHLKRTLLPLPREITAFITGDFPKGEQIEPQIISLNGKDVRENIFKPGTYNLVIQQPGYQLLEEKVVIKPDDDPLLIERELITLPRKIKEDIKYDMQPPSHLSPYKIVIAPLDDPKNERVIRAGEKLKPGSYYLKITKNAYSTIEDRIHVWPVESPYCLSYTLCAKLVTVKLNIIYDIAPPPALYGVKVALIDKILSIPRIVRDGKSVKPGVYYLDIQRPGYKSTPKEEITIEPSEKPFKINRKLFAKQRRISFDMLDPKSPVLVQAYKILNGAKNVSSEDEFQPGKQYKLIIKFKEYKTVKVSFKMIPGEGLYVIYLPLSQLKKYDFNVRKDTLMIDGIKYNYQFYADSELIEDHLINKEKGLGRIYYSVWVDPKAKKLKTYAGFLFSQIDFSRISYGIDRLNNIDLSRFIKHLGRYSQGQKDYKDVLDIIEKKFKRSNYQRMLKQCQKTEIEQLIVYIKALKITDSKAKIRVENLVDLLEKYK